MEIDGNEALDFVHGDDQSKYHSELLALAKEFISKLKSKCATSGSVRSRLGRPNLHRLLDLYNHTIPNYSHALYFSDMTFELNHQPLKRSMLRNTNSTYHIAAVHQVLGLDWFTRICDLVAHRSACEQKLRDAPPGCGDDNSLINISLSLRRLFFGAQVDDLIDSNVENVQSFLTELDTHINRILCIKFVVLLNRWYSSRICSCSRGQCIGVLPKSTNQASKKSRSSTVASYTSLDKAFYDEACQCLEDFQRTTEPGASLCSMESAFFKQTLGSFTRRRYPHHKLSIGHFIECFVDTTGPDEFIYPSETGTRKRHIYLLHGFVGDRDGKTSPWFLAVEGHESQQIQNIPYHSFPEPDNTTLKYLQLRHTVRKCFSLHACNIDGGCHYDLDKKTILPSM